MVINSIRRMYIQRVCISKAKKKEERTVVPRIVRSHEFTHNRHLRSHDEAFIAPRQKVKRIRRNSFLALIAVNPQRDVALGSFQFMIHDLRPGDRVCRVTLILTTVS